MICVWLRVAVRRTNFGAKSKGQKLEVRMTRTAQLESVTLLESEGTEGEMLSEVTSALLDHPSRLRARLSVAVPETGDLMLPYMGQEERGDDTSDEETPAGGDVENGGSREGRRHRRKRRGSMQIGDNRW